MTKNKRYSVAQMQELLEKDSSICNLSDLSFAQVVHNDQELLDFFQRFVCFDSNTCWVNYDVLQDFIQVNTKNVEEEIEGEIEEWEEEPEVHTKKIKVLEYNPYFDEPFSLFDAELHYYKSEDLTLLEKPSEYPCIVTASFSDSFDRMGDVSTRLVKFIPLSILNKKIMIL